MEIAGVEISSPDKILFPREQITKLQVLQYYGKVAEKMLPYLKDRPLTLHRFPNGIKDDGFYQKNAGDYFPSFVKRIEIKTKEGSNTQVLCNDRRSLIYLANQGTLSFHIWLSRKDKLNKPDKIVFDLDPSEKDFTKVKEAARIVGDYLRKKDIEPKVMTTGQNGLHVWYSVRRTKNFDQVREEVKIIAEELEEQYPELLTTAVRKNKRGDKIFVDYLRNAYGQTSVCPYSLRPNEAAGIAMPISWNELEKIKSSDEFRLSGFMGS